MRGPAAPWVFATDYHLPATDDDLLLNVEVQTPGPNDDCTGGIRLEDTTTDEVFVPECHLPALVQIIRKHFPEALEEKA